MALRRPELRNTSQPCGPLGVTYSQVWYYWFCYYFIRYNFIINYITVINSLHSLVILARFVQTYYHYWHITHHTHPKFNTSLNSLKSPFLHTLQNPWKFTLSHIYTHLWSYSLTSLHIIITSQSHITSHQQHQTNNPHAKDPKNAVFGPFLEGLKKRQFLMLLTPWCQHQQHR